MPLRHTLLGLLDRTSLHGYALREKAKGYAWLYPMSNANLYPVLRQLEDEGFVRREEQIHDGRLRKVYSVTDAGRAELRRWLADPSGQRGTYRDPTVLKISLLRDASLAPARSWIEQDLREVTTVVETAEVWLKEDGLELGKYERLVAEYGLDLARVRARWLAQVLEEIDADVGGAEADDEPDLV
jgi:DNA-binding PadR family transcriptional regulator